MAETMTLQGGCLCGRIRYEVSPESDEGYYCHCRMCQLAFGNTRAAFINVPQTAVRWLTEPPKLHASSSFARRGFCPDCGTNLWWEPARLPALIGVASGAFADPAFPMPEQAVWAVDRHPWVMLPEAVTQHERNPVRR